MTKEPNREEEGWTRHIDVELLIVHPTMNPLEITKGLKLSPTNEHCVGDIRSTPQGKPIGGDYRDSRWRHSVRFELREQWFEEEIVQLIEHLERHVAFLHEIRASGGRSQLIVQFLGDGYFGDTVSLETLARMVALRVDFGIEVYGVPQA